MQDCVQIQNMNVLLLQLCSVCPLCAAVGTVIAPSTGISGALNVYFYKIGKCKEYYFENTLLKT